jgi:hypothetical protein
VIFIVVDVFVKCGGGGGICLFDCCCCRTPVTFLGGFKEDSDTVALTSRTDALPRHRQELFFLRLQGFGFGV